MPRGGRYRPPEYTSRILAAYDAAEGPTRTARAKAAAVVAGVDRATVLRVVAVRDGDGRDGKGPGAGSKTARCPERATETAEATAEPAAPPKRRGAGMPPAPPPFPIRRYSLADRRVARRWVVATDVHFGCHDPDAVDVLYQAIGIIRPDAFCDLGDIGEWQACSRHRKTKGAPADYLLAEYDDEIADVNGHLDKRDDVLDRAGVRERVQLTGNHDAWLDDIARDDPRNGPYAFATACRMAERKFVVVPRGGWHVFTPGLLGNHADTIRSSIGHPRAILAKCGGASVLYGDKHAVSVWWEPGRDPATGANVQRLAACLGTLKDRRPEANTWLRGDTTRWAAAFGIVSVYASGRWAVNVVSIDEGRCDLYGETIVARERRAA